MPLPRSTPDQLSIIQIAYVVDDLEAAARRWFTAFGIGPFLAIRHILATEVIYRGTPGSLDISIALAQVGDVQIELIVQHCDSPSVFRRGPCGSLWQGMHHLAVFPDDYDALIASYAARGFFVAGELVTGENRGAAYIDTTALNGHLLEVYRPDPTLEKIYAAVKASAESWDGQTLLIG